MDKLNLLQEAVRSINWRKRDIDENEMSEQDIKEAKEMNDFIEDLSKVLLQKGMDYICKSST